MSVRPLCTDLQNKARDELNEDSRRVQEDIQHIRNWVSQQKHLACRTDDQWILTFLRGCKFNLQKTKDKLDMFYTMRSLLPELYKNRDPMLPEIQEILKLGLFLPLLKTDGPAGPRVILLRCEPIDTTKLQFVNCIKTALMIIDVLLNEDDNFIIAGQHGVFDLKGMKLSHIFHVNLSIVKKVGIYLQRAYPTRPKGFHFINIVSFLEIILNLMKPILSEKLRKRINIYSGNTNKFHKNISPTILPKEYDGYADSIDELTSYWKEKVESCRSWFLDDEHCGSDETKRNGICKTSSDLFGIEKTFGNLDVD